jgi:GT2 family glycosyltransferase
VVLLTYNGSAMTCAALDSIAQWAPGVRLIWVDNNSDAAAFATVTDWFATHPDAVALQPCPRLRNDGFPVGMNDGIDVALRDPAVEYVVLCNNDIVLHNQAFQYMRRALEAYRGLGIINPMSTNGSRPDYLVDLAHMLPADAPFGEVLDAPTHAERGALLAQYADLVCTVTDVSFFCTMIRRDVFARIGWLDEAYGMGWGEDDQFCWRAAKVGFRIGVAVGAFVEHHHRATWNMVLSRKEQHAQFAAAQAQHARWRAAGELVYIPRL